MTTKPTRIEPGAGQESVWDYPRPPALEAVAETLRVDLAGIAVALTDRGFRVLETSHPPVYYFPPDDVRLDAFEPTPGRSFCEFKGAAAYWSVEVAGKRVERGAWTYPDPTPAFRRIAGYFAFYPSKFDACWVGDERAVAQTGDFYGGWITDRVVGPFKGGAGTRFW